MDFITENDRAEVGTTLSLLTSFLIVGAIVGAGIYYLHSKQLLLRKSNPNGVAFENPSYLREVSMDNIQVIAYNYYFIIGTFTFFTFSVPIFFLPLAFSWFKLSSELVLTIFLIVIIIFEKNLKFER